jgi:AsmA protein
MTKDGLNAVVDGNIRFDKELLKIDMKGRSGKNTASLKGTVKDYTGEPRIKMDIYSKKLFLDELIPAGTKKKASPSKQTKVSAAAAAEEAEPLDLKLAASGEVKVDSAVYKGLEMTNYNMKYQLKDNRLEIERMSAEAGKGRLDLVSTIDLSKPGYSYKLSSNIDSLHADEVVNALFPRAKDTVYGVLSLNMNLNGAGTLPASIKKNLVASGNFNIKNGKITNAPLADELALLLGVDDLKTIELKKAKGSIDIRNGVAVLSSIFSSDDLSMNPSGKIGLDETLDLAFDLKLSPELTDRVSRNSSIAQYIKDEEGWGQIPLKIAGTFSDPSYTVDVAKAGKRVIRKKAQELIEDILNIDKGKERTAPQGETESEPSVPDLQKPIEDLLKGIFN